MSTRKRLLLIDDEDELLNILKREFEESTDFDVSIFTASDGEEGLSKATKLQPDLIITDIKMPNVDGFTLIKQLRKAGGDKPIPTMVFSSFPKMKDLFAQEGIDNYFEKPDDLDPMLKKAQEFLHPDH